MPQCARTVDSAVFALSRFFGVLAASVRDGFGAAPVAWSTEATNGAAEIRNRKNSGYSRAS